jgi:hypothetical protein
MEGERDAPAAQASADFATAWQQVMREPRAFFAAMPEGGGLEGPMRFLAICAGLDAVGTALFGWSLLGGVSAFVALVVGSVVLAAVLTLVTQHLLDGRAGFEPVFRVVAYGSAPAVFFWVPRLAAIPLLYAWFLQTRGLERVQGFDATRAAFATVLAWVAVAIVARALAGYPLGWPGTW